MSHNPLISMEKPQCVLLHGFGIDSRVWAPFAKLLSKRFQVHLIDLPGYGDNKEQAIETWQCEELADFVLSRAPAKALWIGWSLGGMLATFIAAHHPHRVSGLITIASNPKLVANEEWPHAMSQHDFENFAENLHQAYEQTLQRFLMLNCLGNEKVYSQLRQIKALAKNKPHQQSLLHGMSLLQRLDVRPLLGSIRCPVRQIFGERDKLVPQLVAQKIQWLYPGMKSTIIPKAGHAPFLSHPTDTYAEVEEFYDTHIRHAHH